MMKSKPLYLAVVYQSPSNATLTIYKAKKTKLVYLLSPTYKTVRIDETHKKKMPETIKYYNLSKVSVDVLVLYLQKCYEKMASGRIFQDYRLCLHKCIRHLP